MKRRCLAPLSQREHTPFTTAEAAWMWFWRCQLARHEGARFVADVGSVARPCEPDDIYLTLSALARQRIVGTEHLRVLVHFGRALTPPDHRLERQHAAARLWVEGLRALTTPLKSKGILA